VLPRWGARTIVEELEAVKSMPGKYVMRMKRVVSGGAPGGKISRTGKCTSRTVDSVNSKDLTTTPEEKKK